MKRTVALILSIMMMLCLVACSGGEDEVKDVDMEVVKTALCDVALTEDMQQLDDTYISRMIKLESEDYIEGYAAISSVGINIDEFGVFKAKDAAQAAEIENTLKSYLNTRNDAWIDSYLPDQYPKLQSASVHTEGLYVCYFILDDATKTAALDAFEACFD